MGGLQWVGLGHRADDRGLLINQFGWRSIFFVVVPLGMAALSLAMPSIPESSDPSGRHFDMPGQILGALALGSVSFAAIESHGAARVAGVALAGAVLSLALFIKVEAKRAAGALVPIEMFAAREFRGAVAATAGMTFGMYGVLFLLPLTWQRGGKLGPVGAGIALMPMALLFVLVSPFSGALTEKLGTRFMTGGGVAVIGCGLLVIAMTADASSILAAEVGLALTGIGMGLATGPLMGVAVGAVAAARSGTAAALINVARMAGTTIGVAVLGTAFTIAEGGSEGLLLAMLIGGLVQLTSAAVVWHATRPATASAR